MTRTLLVSSSPKNFKIEVPDDAKLTFGPFSPPTGKDPDYARGAKAVGTLRVYGRSKEDVLGVFSNVSGFRDISSISYSEEVAREEGAVIWKSDKDGYTREEKVSRAKEWTPDPAGSLLTAGATDLSSADDEVIF